MYRILLTILSFFVLTPVFAQRARDTFKLFFDLNVAKLNEATEKRIDLLIYNDKIITGSNITIIGYADYLGGEAYNKDLSMKRAENVKNYLVKYGVSAKDITLCMGKGKVERQGMSGPDGYQKDRRVDVVVNNSTTPSAPKVTIKRRDTIRQVNVTSIDQINHLKPGSVFALKNVYFPPDRHVITPESVETLDKLVVVLKDNPYLKISIEGHVCCIINAPDAYDSDTGEPTLSVNRARAIFNYLVERGIDPDRLKYSGYGRRRPVVIVERDEPDREKNRRVEIRIIENRNN